MIDKDHMRGDHVSVQFTRRQVEVLLRAMETTAMEPTGALRHAIAKLRRALDEGGK